MLEKIIGKSIENLDVLIISSYLFACAFLFLLRRNYSHSLLTLTVSFIVFLYSKGFLSWFSSLGADSFFESRNFDFMEAYFWFNNFLSASSQMRMPFDRTSLLLIVEAMFLAIVWFFILRWRPTLLRLMPIMLIASVAYVAYFGYVGFQLSKIYTSDLKSQFNTNDGGFVATDDVDLFVYIGESTSTINLSLYGYPLKTTPRLDEFASKDKGFLHFEGVRSRYTHTSPSLLDSLAISSSRSDGRIVKWGIGNILNKSGVNARLYSVQPVSGTFSIFAHFVFDGLIFEQVEGGAGRGNYLPPTVKDHQLLEVALKDPGVVFFHSYAGHGDYLNLIEAKLSQDLKRPAIEFNGMYGSRFSKYADSDLPSQVSDYDRAITYIDRNVARAIEAIKLRSKPAAFIYFSDHGESVFTKRAHDSSKFIDEMSKVPLVIYFNETYRKKYPEIYSMYLKATSSKKSRILDQISPTILDILRIKSNYSIDVPTVASESKHPRLYILDRKTLTGSSRIDLNYDSTVGFSMAKFVGGTSEPTYISIINENFRDELGICYHRADSYAKAIRAAAMTNCIEFDLMVDGDALNVYHPPATATGFQIEHIFNIAQARRNSLWIDSKNLDDPIACNKLATYLERNYRRVGQIFVEFPDRASVRLHELQSCSDRLKGIGARRSYYVPTHLLLSCTEYSNNSASACKELDDNVQKAMASGIFTDLSFDFLGYPAIKRIKGADKFKWNTWAIKAQDFHHFPRKDFGFVIMDTSTDPNTY